VINEKHAMVDIETMDNGPQAAVINIGIRIFTVKGGPGKGFEVFIDPSLASQIGTVSDDTMRWWARQPTREQVFSGRVDPVEAVHRMIQFCKEHNAEYIWANSPGFDVTILRHLCKQVSLQFPFHYRAERDCRTLFSLGRMLDIDCEDLWANSARQAHLALDDATQQAEVVCRILGTLVNSPVAHSSPDSDPVLVVPGQSEASAASTEPNSPP
jgi:hypothetical protein